VAVRVSVTRWVVVRAVVEAPVAGVEAAGLLAELAGLLTGLLAALLGCGPDVPLGLTGLVV
jgi:hypothetical protein